LDIGGTKMDVLDFADDLNVIENTKETEVWNTATLIDKAKTIGLLVNGEKTKVMRVIGK